MWPVSDAFQAAVRTSHQVQIIAEVWAGDTMLAAVPIIAGSVTIDYKRTTRRECAITVASDDGAWIPGDASDVLSPLTGNELHLSRGVVFPDGTVEMVPLGVFRIVTAKATDDSSRSIAVTGRDRADRIRRSRWTRPYNVYAGGAVEDVLDMLLTDRMPSIETAFIPTGATVPTLTLGLDTNNDPWADAQKIAHDAGFDLYFDASGTAVISTPATDATFPVIAYEDGTDAVLTSISKEWSADSAYNGVVVTGEGTDAPSPYRAEVWDDDPSSPTYKLGPFGMIAMFYSSPLLTSQAQCEFAAATILARSLGIAQALTWTQIVNPALDVGDVVLVTRPALKVAELAIVDQLTIPLDAGTGASAVIRTINTDGG